MRLLSYLATASAVLACAIVLSISVASLKEYCVIASQVQRKRFKRSGPIFVIKSEHLEDMWRDVILPKVEQHTGCNTTTIEDFTPGKVMFEQYYNSVCSCSALVIVLDQILLEDPKLWYVYVLQLACNENVPIVLCHPHNIQIPNAVETIVQLKGEVIPYCPEHLNVNRLAEDLALGFTKAQTEELNLPIFNSMGIDTKFRHDVYLVHDPKDDWVPRNVFPYLKNQGIRNIIPSSGVPLGRYLCLCQVEAAQESQYIYIMLTPNLLKNPLFEFHLSLAMAFKEADSIVFLVDGTDPTEGLLPHNRAFDYAFAVCKKIRILRKDT